MNNLKGKVALITGGTSGIGAACANRFARAGAIVIITGRNKDKGILIANSIKEQGLEAEYVYSDIAVDDDIIELAKYINEKYEGLDILFNNAGVYPLFTSIEEIDRKSIDEVFSVNSASLIMVTRYMFPLLNKRKGVVLNNASVAGIQSFASGQGYAYAASKSAVIQFTRMFAKKYGGEIRTVCICPGVIETPLYNNFDATKFEDRIPLGRVGNPEDVAKVANFLVSEDAGYINGAIIPIDGGLTL